MCLKIIVILPPTYQTHIVHGIDSGIVSFRMDDVLCVQCQYIAIHSGNVYFLLIKGNILEINKRGGRGIRKIINKVPRTKTQKFQLHMTLLTP